MFDCWQKFNSKYYTKGIKVNIFIGNQLQAFFPRCAPAGQAVHIVQAKKFHQ